MLTIFRMGLPLYVLATSTAAQSHREVITESTVTVGRGGELSGGGLVPVADLGIRWTRPSGFGYGFTVFGGRDFPNEATLVGVRLRVTQATRLGTVEGALSAVASSAGSGGLGHPAGLGGILGLAYYPVASLAVLAQLDVIPTYEATAPNGLTPGDPGFSSETLRRRPALSAGIRLARRPGLVTLMGGAALGIVAIAYDH